MKKLFAIGLVLCIFFCVSGCSNINSHHNHFEIGNSKHTIELNCPELENISNFVFGSKGKNHYFSDKSGNLYEISFDKLFSETMTNAKPYNGMCEFGLLQEQALYEGVLETGLGGDIEIESLFDVEKATYLDSFFFGFKGRKLLKIGVNYDFANKKFFVETNELIAEFNEDIVSVNGCIIKTETKFYAIECYVTNAEDLEKYADVDAEKGFRIVELDESTFAIPIINVKFLYMPDSTEKSYFMIDDNNNYYYYYNTRA